MVNAGDRELAPSSQKVMPVYNLGVLKDTVTKPDSRFAPSSAREVPSQRNRSKQVQQRASVRRQPTEIVVQHWYAVVQHWHAVVPQRGGRRATEQLPLRNDPVSPADGRPIPALPEVGAVSTVRDGGAAGQRPTLS